MYRVAICDDEEIFLEHMVETVQKVLDELEAVYELTAFSDGQELLQAVERDHSRFHLLIMDILMEPVNGFALAKQMRGSGCEAGILFVTSTDGYTLEGYSLYPVQYLMKPVTKQQLFEAVSRDYRERFMTQYLLIPASHGNTVLRLNRIDYLETLNRRTFVHTAGEAVETPETMRSLLERLPETAFVRCHKSFAVNLRRIFRITRTAILLENGKEIPVGRAFYDGTLRALVDCLEQK